MTKELDGTREEDEGGLGSILFPIEDREPRNLGYEQRLSFEAGRARFYVLYGGFQVH